MQRNGTSERNASQPKGGQPPGANEEDDESPQNDAVPSFLTARELQARAPAKGVVQNDDAVEEDDEDDVKAPPATKPKPK